MTLTDGEIVLFWTLLVLVCSVFGTAIVAVFLSAVRDTDRIEHQAVQYSDQMVCSCGNVWDMNDPYPPEECTKETP